jgi:hypothetical protein
MQKKFCYSAWNVQKVAVYICALLGPLLYAAKYSCKIATSQVQILNLYHKQIYHCYVCGEWEAWHKLKWKFLLCLDIKVLWNLGSLSLSSMQLEDPRKHSVHEQGNGWKSYPKFPKWINVGTVSLNVFSTFSMQQNVRSPLKSKFLCSLQYVRWF